MTAGEFMAACSSFARRHPAAVLEMPAPELAVDDRAAARHVRRTRLAARQRMRLTAELTLKNAAAIARHQAKAAESDLFTPKQAERMSA